MRRARLTADSTAGRDAAIMPSMQAASTVSRDSRVEAKAPHPAARRSPRGNPLAREVTVVLAVKLIAILLLWLAFFRPVDAPGPSPTVRSVTEHIAAPTPLPEVPVADR